TLSESHAIAVKNFTDIRQESAHHTGKLSTIVPRSWFYGSLSTWIGSEEKNYAWDLLVQAKQQWDEVMASGNLTKAQIEAVTRQLAICEGSDWFWWFGDYNPSGSVSDFDRLYRRQLMGLYQLMGIDAPEILNSPISEGGGDAENSGTMLRNS
ncbi:MAG: glycoside hydrolase, partial [Gammaproteobacteria bacterium]|nr:glycoside hydrolase [Gammaproteobacteria bacterium]